MLLAYTGAVWEDIQYTSPEQWFGGDKQNLHLDFPNLPYLVDGNLKITETTAICSYIVERSNRGELLGKNVQDRAVILNLLGVIGECIDKLSTIAYSPDGAKLLEKTWKDTLAPKLENLAKYKGKKTWVFNYLTVADFLLVEASYYIENIYKEQYQTLKFLHELRESFHGIPEIKTYYQQEWSIKAPFVAPNFATIKF